jgi:hypothetical protein
MPERVGLLMMLAKLCCCRTLLHKKRIRTWYAKLVFLLSVGSVGQVVHFDVSGRETSTHYFLCSGGLSAVYIKSTSGHVM